jgi:hypothetical protein
VQFTGLMLGRRAPGWTLRVVGDDQELQMSFPTSYVFARLGGRRAEDEGPVRELALY